MVGAGTQPSGEADPPVGNGRAISVRCAAEGASVACLDVRGPAAAETLALVEEGGGNGIVIEADVTDAADCSRAVAEAATGLAGLDGVVLNVGIGLGMGLAHTTVEQWDRTFAVNVRSHFLVTKEAMGPLSQAAGDGVPAAVVFVSSVAGLKPGSRIPAYDSSKAAAGRAVPAGGRRGCPSPGPGQCGGPRPHRHPTRPAGLGGPAEQDLDPGAPRPAGHGLGGGQRGGLPALGRSPVRDRPGARGRRRIEHPSLTSLVRTGWRSTLSGDSRRT